MGQVTLVRHGQASVQGPSYDALSALGHSQATLLGEFWVERQVSFERVYIGPRQRHAQTASRVADVYRAHGLAWPDPMPMPMLDEHHGIQVLKRAAGILEPGDALLTGESDRDTAVRRLFGRYREVMAEWAAGGYADETIEPWRAFRLRAAAVVEEICAGNGHVVAFTSGGLMAAAVGAVLSLDDPRVVHLSAEIHNTALTELRHRSGEVSLMSFNAIPHLRDDAVITRV
jgi:broad specificity phosphatase PhoE